MMRCILIFLFFSLYPDRAKSHLALFRCCFHHILYLTVVRCDADESKRCLLCMKQVSKTNKSLINPTQCTSAWMVISLFHSFDYLISDIVVSVLMSAEREMKSLKKGAGKREKQQKKKMKRKTRRRKSQRKIEITSRTN